MKGTGINISERGQLTEMEFFKVWKFQNKKLLKEVYDDAIKVATIMLVAPLSFEDFCANTYIHAACMVPVCNN